MHMDILSIRSLLVSNDAGFRKLKPCTVSENETFVLVQWIHYIDSVMVCVHFSDMWMETMTKSQMKHTKLRLTNIYSSDDHTIGNITMLFVMDA